MPDIDYRRAFFALMRVFVDNSNATYVQDCLNDLPSDIRASCLDVLYDCEDDIFVSDCMRVCAERRARASWRHESGFFDPDFNGYVWHV